MKKNLFRCLVAGLFYCGSAFAQTQPAIPPEGVEITKAIPASADAAALGKYGRIPVSPFTGVPNISIPLYSIKSGDLSLPVSLSYHASGIKVEEMASSVGLGWALNAGGVITRTVRGIADEDVNGFLGPEDYTGNIFNAATMRQPTNLTYDNAGQMLNHVVEGLYDTEADIFTFNFGGYSGQFSFIHGGGGIMISPQQKLKITYPYTEGRPINNFTITTPDGVSYYFGSPDGNSAIETTQRNDPHHKVYNTGWFLSKIVSPSGDQINLTYKPETYDQFQPGGTRYQLVSGQPADDNGQILRQDDDNGSSNSLHTQKLTGISFEGGFINIDASTIRKDLAGTATCIDTIAVYGDKGAFVKLYKFYYLNNAQPRLRLDSLIGELPPDEHGNIKKERYTFQYNPDAWAPTGTSFINAQDWWGYYNANGSSTFVPGIPSPGNGPPTDGADKTPNPQTIANGTLTRITYPSNGYTNFTYEVNQQPTNDFGVDSFTRSDQVTAFSNDPQSIYYNYDTRNGNPDHLMHVYAYENSIEPRAITISAYGLGLGTNPPPPANDFVAATIDQRDTSGNYTPIMNIRNAVDTTIYLQQGDYKITLIDNKRQTDTTRYDYIKYAIAANWVNQLPLANHYLGHVTSGLRIAKIADYDGISTNPYNVKSYTYNLNDTTSSGYLNFQPSYEYILRVLYGDYQNIKESDFDVRKGVSNYPLATQHGSVVGYYRVQEYLDNNGVKGKNEYFYTISGAEGLNNSFPFAPAMTLDWHEGLLVQQINSRYANGQYFPVKKSQNVYTSIKQNQALSFKAGFNPYPLNYNPGVSYLGGASNTGNAGAIGTAGTLILQEYYNATDHTYLSSDTTWVYDATDTTRKVKTWHNYQIDTVTYQPTRLQTLDSKNQLITRSVTYPNNYVVTGTPSGAATGINHLDSLGIYTYPVEEVTNIANADGSNSRTLNAVFSTYKNNRPFRDSVYSLRSVAAVTDFAGSTVNAGNNISKDSRYQPVISFDKYDSFGNIVQERKVGDARHTYIWAYKSNELSFRNLYPVAEVINADSANVAYANFESADTTGSGNWAYAGSLISSDATAPMGFGCLHLNGGSGITKGNLSAASSYIVSFWSKSGATLSVAASSGATVTNTANGNPKSGWTYNEYTVSNSTTVSITGSGYIDEARLYPVSALMTSYTYAPLVGMTAKCDTRNNITYYNFDGVGRLIQVQDQNRNIVKDYQYNYVNTAPAWTDITPVSIVCVKDANGNNTGEEQKQQYDANPYSLSYNTRRWAFAGIDSTACPIPAPATLYVKMRIASSFVSNGFTFNTYEFDVYSDAACTQPYHVLSDLNVNYTAVITTNASGSISQNTCYNTVTIPAGQEFAQTPSINVTGCITCAATGGSGGGGIGPQIARAAQPRTGGDGGPGSGTSCSTTLALTTGSGYTPEY